MNICKYKKLEGVNPLLMRLVLIAETEDYVFVCVDDDQLNIEQPNELEFEVIESLSPEIKDLITEERKKGIKQFISRYVEDKIREQYSLNDELYYARIAIGALQETYELEPGEREELEAYRTFVVETRAWGRNQYSKLGLSNGHD